jgi:hypothetical protein
MFSAAMPTEVKQLATQSLYYPDFVYISDQNSSSLSTVATGTFGGGGGKNTVN